MSPRALFRTVPRLLAPALAVLVMLGATDRIEAQLLLFEEDFEGLPLQPPVDEPISGILEAFTHIPPPGWDRDDSGVPGVGLPNLGVTEWEGWSFANIDFWREAASLDPGPPLRDFFDRGQGTIAVADPDQWNDLGNPANSPDGGFYNTLLQTPVLDVSIGFDPEFRIKVGFDSSWFGGDCCDDGRQFQPPDQPPPFSNNQTAVVNANFTNGQSFELLRWEAAPFLDSAGNPTNDPGPGTIPNPSFKPPDPNERVWLELLPNQAAALAASLGGSGGGAGGPGASIEFGLGNAGDDGYWGVDNAQMWAITTVLGDMDVNGVVESADVAAFALGLLNANEYRNTYYGEFPVTRGSPDGTFDFDDIEWFVGVLESEGVSTSVGEVLAMLSPVPEPTTGLLVAISVASALTGWRADRTRAG